LPSDRRTGRKGKRQNRSSKGLDGKSQAMSSEKESIDSGGLHIEGHLQEQDRFHDPLLADSGKSYTFARFRLWYCHLSYFKHLQPFFGIGFILLTFKVLSVRRALIFLAILWNVELT
jgi:hypothetical protein